MDYAEAQAAEVKAALEKIAEQVATKHGELRAEFNDLRLHIVGGEHSRLNAGGGADGVKYLLTKDGQKLPLLTKNQSFASTIIERDTGDFDLGEFCRAGVLGSRKAVSGPQYVPTYLAAQIIDAVRAQAVLLQAGSSTLPIEGPTVLARLVTAPTVYDHDEGVVDIAESDIVTEPVTLNPRLLVALIPLSAELVQDSPNLSAILELALAGAFALKADQLGIAALLADVAIPKSGAAQSPATWAGTLGAVGAALALNQGVPLAHISSAADWAARAAQVASTSGMWLGAPPSLVGMTELATTSLNAGTALLGDFSQALAFVVRSDLALEIVRFGKPTSAMHMLIAHARFGFAVLQPGRLFKQLLVP
jgi:hypothetical protein